MVHRPGTSKGYIGMSGDGLTVGSAAKIPVGRLNRHFRPGCLRSCPPWGLQIKSPGPMSKAGLTVGSAAKNPVGRLKGNNPPSSFFGKHC